MVLVLCMLAHCHSLPGHLMELSHDTIYFTCTFPAKSECLLWKRSMLLSRGFFWTEDIFILFRKAKV